MNENREFQIFEDYTKSVCRKIMSQKKKNEVREELSSHLLEEYERNFALGMDDESAQLKAIEKMGDQDKIAKDFGALYSVIPTEYMRSSLNLIIWGMALTFFQINLFTGFSEITKFIGKMLLIYGLLKLKETDKKFKKAFYLNIGLELYGLIMQNIALYTVDKNDFLLLDSFIAMTLNLLVYWWIFSGINNLCKNLISEDDKKPHLISSFIAYVFISIIIIFAALTEATFLAMGTPLLMIFALWQLNRAKKILAYKEPEFDLKETLKINEKVAYWILIIILAITPIISMLVAASPDVNAEIYNTSDINVDKSEVEFAKNNMLELGFPQEYLKDLPDSEILKYGEATYMLLENTTEVKKTNLANEREVVCTVETFHFHYSDGEIRIMMRAEIPESSPAKYRKGLYHQFYNNRFVPFDEDNNNGEFFIALSDKDGKTYSTAPLSEFTPKNAIDKFYISGFEFTFVKNSNNRRAYLAHSALMQDPYTEQASCTDGAFFWQSLPINVDNTSINDMAILEFDGVIDFGGSDFESIKRYDLYNYFDYYPHYMIKDKQIDSDEIAD